MAATIKYADNILKGFATSLSLLVSSLASWLLLHDLAPGPYFFPGCGLVLAASLGYGLPSTNTSNSSSSNNSMNKEVVTKSGGPVSEDVET